MNIQSSKRGRAGAGAPAALARDRFMHLVDDALVVVGVVLIALARAH